MSVQLVAWMGWPQFASTFDDVVCLLVIFFSIIFVVVFGVFVSQKVPDITNLLNPWCLSFWHHCDGYSFRLDSLTFSVYISASTLSLVVVIFVVVAITAHCLVLHFSVRLCFWVVCGNDGLEICQMSEQHRALFRAHIPQGGWEGEYWKTLDKTK